jgi:hypothetical protein
MNIVPEGESLRKAIQWVSEEIESRPEEKLHKLVEEACTRFDLSPSDSEFIIRFYRKERNG